MNSEEIFRYSVLIAALFLESIRFPHKIHLRFAKPVLDCLVAGCGSFSSVSREFERKGLWEARERLRLLGIVEWAARNVSSGRAVTVFQPSYPRMLTKNNAELAPPALWCSGELTSLPLVAVLGRSTTRLSEDFAFAAGIAIARGGGCVVTCLGDESELAAERGALEDGGKTLRTCSAEFAHQLPDSTGAPANFLAAPSVSPHRLALLISEACLVVHAEVKEETVWRDFKEAMRLNEAELFVHASSGECWWRPFVFLGARPIEHSGELGQLLEAGFRSRTGRNGLKSSR